MAGNKSTQAGSSVSPGDLLAMERTRLANERTLLAYIRTALATLAAAVSLIQFFESRAFIISGCFLLPVGLILLIVGFKRYSSSKKLTNGIIL
jgi:putative membrane protein